MTHSPVLSSPKPTRQRDLCVTVAAGAVCCDATQHKAAITATGQGAAARLPIRKRKRGAQASHR